MMTTTNNTAIAIGQPVIDDAAVFHSAKSHLSDETDVTSQDLEYDEPSRERALAMKEQALRLLEEADAEQRAAEENERDLAATGQLLGEIVDVSVSERTQQNKLHMITMPTQSGKTRQSTTGIARSQQLDATEGLSLNLVFTQNVRLSERQFLGRVLRDPAIVGAVAVMTSNPRKSTGEARHLEFTSFDDPAFKRHLRAQKAFAEGKRISTVIMCAHPARIVQTQGLLEDIDDLNEAGRNAHKRVFIHFDELHESIGMSTADANGETVTTRGLIEAAIGLPFVHTVLGMSATPRKVLKAFESMPLLRYVDPSLDTTYVGLRDCRFQIVDFHPDVKDKKNPLAEAPDYAEVQYQRWVLSQHPEIMSAGAVVYAPSNNLTAAHTDTRDLFLETNPQTMVVTINGKTKVAGGAVLHFYEDPSAESPLLVSLDLDKHYPEGEISDRLEEAILADPRLSQERPLVITGNRCISTGATLVNGGTGPFQSAIMYGTGSDKGEDELTDTQVADLYQTFGRVTGQRNFQYEPRWADWCVDGRLPPTAIYCPGQVKAVVIGQEHSAFTLGDRSAEPGVAGPSDSTVTAEEERELFLRKYREEERALPHFKTRKELVREAKHAAREENRRLAQEEAAERKRLRAEEAARKRAEAAAKKRVEAATHFVRDTNKTMLINSIIEVLKSHPGVEMSARQIYDELIKPPYSVNTEKVHSKTVAGELKHRHSGRLAGTLQQLEARVQRIEHNARKINWVYN